MNEVRAALENVGNIQNTILELCEKFENSYGCKISKIEMDSKLCHSFLKEMGAKNKYDNEVQTGYIGTIWGYSFEAIDSFENGIRILSEDNKKLDYVETSFVLKTSKMKYIFGG